MRIAILLTTFNRPEYLRQCLDSLRRADLSEIETVMIVDDVSTDKQTTGIIWNVPDYFDCRVVIVYQEKNMSVKQSLLTGCDQLFEEGHDIVINLDADAIVRNDFVDVLLSLQEAFPSQIITGFNCTTKNRNGSIRHKVLAQLPTYNVKATVGGINMCFNKTIYERCIRPALVDCLANGGNWDQKACLNCDEPVVCAVPSVVQHIGVKSSMGHTSSGEPADVADDFKMLSLPQVGLIGVDDNMTALVNPFVQSCTHIEFGCEIMLSYQNAWNKATIRKLGSKKEYSIFMLKELANYIPENVSHILVVQHDGYVVNPAAWDPDWLDFDYCGSPWPWYKDGMQVGNGGFSLRSKRLQEILRDDPAIIPRNDRHIKEYQEDHNLARIYRPYLEKHHGIKFAPLEVAERFGIEAWTLKPPDNEYSGQFGFHGHSVSFKEWNKKHNIK